MSTADTIQVYEILNTIFNQPEKAREATNAFANLVDEKVGLAGSHQQAILHKDIELLGVRIDEKLASQRSEMKEQKSELSRTIYTVGLIQFIGIVGSVLAIVMLFLKK